MPNADPIGGTWAYADPNLTILLNFPVVMNMVLKPEPGQFVIDVDGVPKTPDSVVWELGTQLKLAFSEAVLGPTVVRLQYPKRWPNFVSTQGQPVWPFDLLLTAA